MNYYIGWDVGAWKCTNAKDDSCDAFVVVAEDEVVGFYRDNIGGIIRKVYEAEPEARPEVLIRELFCLCGTYTNQKGFEESSHYYIAIDTPLGWPVHFVDLLNGQASKEWCYQPNGANLNNSLLYRYTEREKLRSGMSVVVDSIGSQSAKGIQLLKMLGAELVSWGVWKIQNITLIETYPKACFVRDEFVHWMLGLSLTQNLSQSFKVQVSKKNEKPKQYQTVLAIADDVFDASVCACVAMAFAKDSPKLASPTKDDPEKWKSEGWIFYPESSGVVPSQSLANGFRASQGNALSFHDALSGLQQFLKNRSSISKGSTKVQK